MTDQNTEYDQPYNQEDYETFSSGENGEMGCKTCGSVFNEEFSDEKQHCSKCKRVLCPYCKEGEEDHEDTGEDNEVLCVYCATGRLSVNDLAKAFIALAEKKGISVSTLYKKALREAKH